MKQIIVDGLKYRYPGAETLALHDVSFEISKGELIGVIGRNLSGKSTLCQSFVGLVPHFYRGAYGGKVIIDGIEVKKSTIREMSRIVGMVFQNPFTQISGSKETVYEEVAFGLENIGVRRSEMIERVEQALEMMDMERYKDRSPFDLSGGQMQRLAIASMIAMKPQVIVLDEPTSQLDPQGAEDVFQAVERLSHEGWTVIVVEHKLEKIAQYADKVLLLDGGRRVDFEIPSKVFSRGDLEKHGVTAPVYTRVCRALDCRMKDSDVYPVTLDAACEVLKKCP
ncbi:energy-coupling factor ABC transporter ATP-binding protein [Melghirimyces algeriensis]|uniref:Energy-coupling factor transport system ATP-binding protein n=1 Tax=Melghirimyces algeriensis TaxID=910412 RepID=A0A521E0K6_9BACL|nr:ABC transporter ATP-binding protein [Melghirimyces algeriensis]SMO77499.1 energy-coupling factor transport system ATP-binding protein [Melghirimyces algeriensis]